MNNANILNNLQIAEKKALQLFDEIIARKLIVSGKTELELNNEIYALATDLLAIEKFWHKRIVRAGKNTLFPYSENPPDLVFRDNEILFFDFGPVFEEWEADIGKTFVLGTNESMHQIQRDSETIWEKASKFYQNNKSEIKASDFYAYVSSLAEKAGWEYGNEHSGHIIGRFPHEKLLTDEIVNYIHPENNTKMNDLDRLGNERHWILEVHLIDREKEIGAFYERLM